MVQERGNGFYSYNGKMYQSDIVRACIRPKIKAIGKLTAKHIRETATASARKLAVNPEPYIRFLLEEPNQYMTAAAGEAGRAAGPQQQRVCRDPPG